ncbi:uncharacterized protein PGTG_04705 [Puccinia graminis f. sp. tritici CRL 75-36-700-3]|uniref:Uncharacterized protein n=1 Tax=Puccinia graminis f. sp. tritici (strain CRL 75-36-700-3 / race SCCL) TaxID=418459 RepID=E3K3U7_PUCGT|nr:uncharacterized protein PGTG_04705 [Puccinia graminis f. sp. tritici CRL 75-36-700-3]EFP78749.1 hypothetical protein PGTG_04705 [Puccinia graminis f. sp. tritici CRL 75-36-700-3]
MPSLKIPVLLFALGPLGGNMINQSNYQKIQQQIKQLKQHNMEELNDVVNHLEQLHNYLNSPIEQSGSLNIMGTMPQSLVQPIFQNPSQSLKSKIFGKLEIKSLKSTARNQNLKEIIKSEVVPIWEHLQAEFIHHKCKTEDDAEIKLNYLESLFLLADYIYTNQFLTEEMMGNIDIFKQETIIKMVKFHVDLLITSKGENLFGSLE